ncbi:MAG: hypothetical protein ABII21_01025 [bacterium]
MEKIIGYWPEKGLRVKSGELTRIEFVILAKAEGMGYYAATALPAIGAKNKNELFTVGLNDRKKFSTIEELENFLRGQYEFQPVESED